MDSSSETELGPEGFASQESEGLHDETTDCLSLFLQIIALQYYIPTATINHLHIPGFGIGDDGYSGGVLHVFRGYVSGIPSPVVTGANLLASGGRGGPRDARGPTRFKRLNTLRSKSAPGPYSPRPVGGDFCSRIPHT